ncbi:hypothetical protein TTRE_0000845201 [Trichuris trichiura]|uniref:Uncharacterized protein n=1 Tax=Trichuris trichiura TaxID=36087 RepID=A0A077ZK22_TRITR|nr:hypothetical protein TTRE_0000845201 [Trichuris trichiura]
MEPVPYDITDDAKKRAILPRFRGSSMYSLIRSRDQRPNESIADFVAALRRLSEHCNFGNAVDKALRNRLVCGIADEVLQRRLLAQQVGMFDVALKEALLTETARQQALKIRTAGGRRTCKTGQGSQQNVIAVAGHMTPKRADLLTNVAGVVNKLAI